MDKCNHENSENIIFHLQDVMNKKGYIDKQSILDISERLHVSTAEVYGVATFYAQFKLKPNAKHSISVCTGTACFVLGANAICQTLEKRLEIKDGELTKDGLFELHYVRCLGCCGMAPVISIDGQIYSKVTPLKINELIDSLIKEANNE